MHSEIGTEQGGAIPHTMEMRDRPVHSYCNPFGWCNMKNAFVQLVKCIFSIHRMYFFKLHNVFVERADNGGQGIARTESHSRVACCNPCDHHLCPGISKLSLSFLHSTLPLVINTIISITTTTSVIIIIYMVNFSELSIRINL